MLDKLCDFTVNFLVGVFEVIGLERNIIVSKKDNMFCHLQIKKNTKSKQPAMVGVFLFVGIIAMLRVQSCYCVT